MYRLQRQPPLRRRAAAVALVLAVHVVAIAGFLQIRARSDQTPDQVPIQVAFVEDAPVQDAPVSPRPKVQPMDVQPVIVDLPQFELPLVAQEAPSTAITVAAPTDSAPVAPAPSASTDAPVVVASVDYVKPPAPVYPPKARRTRAEGTVLLQVVIDVQGRARDVQVHRSSGHAELDEAARVAVLAATFRPYVQNGLARTASVIVPIEFTLMGRVASR